MTRCCTPHTFPETGHQTESTRAAWASTTRLCTHFWSCIGYLSLTKHTSHLKYTIPPAVLLTRLYRPLFTKIDAYKVAFLVIVGALSGASWPR